MIISYAQNQEDIILWRVFKSLKNGTYIDVGANSPINDSITKLFYENGWRGINIEPLEHHYKALKEDRPDDVNLNILVGNDTQTVPFYEVIGGDGLSTIDHDIASQHSQDPNFSLQEHSLEMTTLDDILQKNSVSEIHFMKIDVEGAEKNVLEGLSLCKYRPIVFVIESTLPNSTTKSHMEWEFLLTKNGYECVLFDGLNRFYLDKKYEDLKEALSYPACPHDQYETLQCVNQKVMVKNQAMVISLLENKLSALYNSNSWKVTAPLRALVNRMQRFSKKVGV